MQTILVLNAGSSSVKVSLICPASPSGNTSDSSSKPIRIVTAHGERLGTEYSSLHISISMAAADFVSNPVATWKALKHSHSLQLTARATVKQNDHDSNRGNTDCDPPIIKTLTIEEPNMSHKAAIQMIIDRTKELKPELIDSVAAVGHRVVHGGEKFSDATVVDKDVLEAIEKISHLAPLHNPSNLEGIRIAMEVFHENVPNIAVFDTAFHSTMPQHVYTYPLPREYTQHQIRKYGFHGTSVKYVSQCAIKRLKAMGKHHDRLIVAHLGNGASVTAVVNGKSVDTSMEFTPLSGIMMGTRSGSVDPSIIIYASDQMEKTPAQVLDDLNKKSGLMGVSGGYSDMRVIIERARNGDADAQLAIKMYVHTLAKHIAGLIVSCGGSIDAIVFTAGVGEHSPLIRKLALEKLSKLLGGLLVDSARNEAHGKNSEGIISVENDDSSISMVLQTDEETMICQECERLVKVNF